MGHMCMTHKICAALTIIGALNWGLVGAFNFNLVNSLFGTWPIVERIIYIAVGISALMMLGVGKCCMKGECGKMDGGMKKMEGGM